MRKKGISRGLRIRIHNYLKYLSDNEFNRLTGEEDSVMQKLSTYLREEILEEVNGKVIKSIPLLYMNFS
jgi:hypothetical protein